jgi:hypothetical protein
MRAHAAEKPVSMALTERWALARAVPRMTALPVMIGRIIVIY